jgi:hypothetical protein
MEGGDVDVWDIEAVLVRLGNPKAADSGDLAFFISASTGEPFLLYKKRRRIPRDDLNFQLDRHGIDIPAFYAALKALQREQGARDGDPPP